MQKNNMENPILLDTHVILWSLLKPNELHSNIKEIIDLAQDKSRLLLSSISLWEIAMLKSKKRINIYEPITEFLKSITAIEGLTIIDITPEIAANSTTLLEDFHGDPADRIITASCVNYGAMLLTRDHQIISWADSGSIKVQKV